MGGTIREYTPREVEALGRYGGFETLLVHTEDIYRQDEAPRVARGVYVAGAVSLERAGQNIFYLGRKSPGATQASLSE